MDLGIAGKTALVWGGSRGLGKAVAARLAHEGVSVHIAARDARTLAAASGEILAATGMTIKTVAADLGTASGRSAALECCPEPDILVNNADGPIPGDFRHWSRDDWIAALDVMMLGPIEMIRQTVDGMAERGFGRIVNISSRSVKIAQPELGLSNGARSGLTGFVAGIARAFVQRDVTINNLLPGPFDTDGQRRHVDSLAERTGRPFGEIWQERAAANPARRYGRPEEFAAYCAFLCSTQAGYITGQNLLIDGGGYPGSF
ncbi:MAG: SDR family oxidoreductase [Candidatus Accumulibacter sp.]|jgi:3-oxoacyl-[acyl-carrier protein] reductase|nr:SDR family oxidoreductase [Accumulibacter sp.]